MEIKQQKADAAAQKENLRDRDRQRLAIRIAQALRDAGLDCEVGALPTIH